MIRNLIPIYFVVSTLSFVIFPLTLPAQAEYGTKFIPPEATAAAVIKPGQWLQHPILKLMPTELMSVESRRIIGLVPEEVASLLVFAGMPDVEGNPRMGMVVRTTGPYDLSKILPELQQGGALVRQQFEGTGVEYLHSKSPQLVSVYPVDETTLIVALPGTLESMLQRITKEPEGTLAKRIHSGRTEAALQVYVVAVGTANIISPCRAMSQNHLCHEQIRSWPRRGRRVFSFLWATDCRVVSTRN